MEGTIIHARSGGEDRQKAPCRTPDRQRDERGLGAVAAEVFDAAQQ